MPTWATMADLSTGDLVTESDMDAMRGNIEYLLDPNADRALYDNSANYTTTSTSFVDVDAANVTATITTNGGKVLLFVTGVASGSATSVNIYFDVDIDGTRLGNGFTDGLVKVVSDGLAGARRNIAFSMVLTGLAAGSHTVKLQWRVSSGTGTLDSNGNLPVGIALIEI